MHANNSWVYAVLCLRPFFFTLIEFENTASNQQDDECSKLPITPEQPPSPLPKSHILNGTSSSYKYKEEGVVVGSKSTRCIRCLRIRKRKKKKKTLYSLFTAISRFLSILQFLDSLFKIFLQFNLAWSKAFSFTNLHFNSLLINLILMFFYMFQVSDNVRLSLGLYFAIDLTVSFPVFFFFLKHLPLKKIDFLAF